MEPILPVTFEPVLPALSRNFGRFEKAQVIAAPPVAKLPYCSGQPQEIASGEWCDSESTYSCVALQPASELISGLPIVIEQELVRIAHRHIALIPVGITPALVAQVGAAEKALVRTVEEGGDIACSFHVVGGASS